MGTHQPIRKLVAPEIPDKLYFRIGDVARICEVPAYVLRFWETEFPQLKPNKGGTGQRLYRKRDVEMALRIKSLLYDQGYTIPGARQVFKSEARAKDVGPGPLVDASAGQAAPQAGQAEPGTASADSAATRARQGKLQMLREEMRAVLAVLSAPAGSVAFRPAMPSASSVPRSKVQAMRPKLVATSADGEGARASARPLLRPGLFVRTDQPDLFPPPPAPAE